MTDTPAVPSSAYDPARRRGSQALVPLVLLVLALVDLRVELQLIADTFTVTSVLTALRHHTLAVAVLILQPSLWRRYGRSAR